ncbi:MAG: PEP-CTERM sorting domain-containing protein [Planctomycetota bacterium]
MVQHRLPEGWPNQLGDPIFKQASEAFGFRTGGKPATQRPSRSSTIATDLMPDAAARTGLREQAGGVSDQMVKDVFSNQLVPARSAPRWDRSIVTSITGDPRSADFSAESNQEAGSSIDEQRLARPRGATAETLADGNPGLTDRSLAAADGKSVAPARGSDGKLNADSMARRRDALGRPLSLLPGSHGSGAGPSIGGFSSVTGNMAGGGATGGGATGGGATGGGMTGGGMTGGGMTGGGLTGGGLTGGGLTGGGLTGGGLTGGGADVTTGSGTTGAGTNGTTAEINLEGTAPEGGLEDGLALIDEVNGANNPGIPGIALGGPQLLTAPGAPVESVSEAGHAAPVAGGVSEPGSSAIEWAPSADTAPLSGEIPLSDPNQLGDDRLPALTMPENPDPRVDNPSSRQMTCTNTDPVVGLPESDGNSSTSVNLSDDPHPPLGESFVEGELSPMDHSSSETATPAVESSAAANVVTQSTETAPSIGEISTSNDIVSIAPPATTVPTNQPLVPPVDSPSQHFISGSDVGSSPGDSPVVPEPGSIVLLGMAGCLGGVGLLRRHIHRRRSESAAVPSDRPEMVSTLRVGF